MFLLVFPEAPSGSLAGRCWDATKHAGKFVCTRAAMRITIMSTELEENGIQSMNT